MYVSIRVSGLDTRRKQQELRFVFIAAATLPALIGTEALLGPHGLQLNDEAGVRSVIARPFTERGNVTKKIVPAPDVRSTVTVPPWS